MTQPTPGWWRNASWLVFPDGQAWIHPETRVDRDRDGGGVRLTCGRTRLAVTLPSDHPLSSLRAV